MRSLAHMYVCVCVGVEVMGTSGPPQTPDGAREIRVHRNMGVCG